MTNRRFDDVRSLGPSKLAPFDPNEPNSERHRRRLGIALEHREWVEGWCRDRRILLQINNDGHHWIFRTAFDRAEWWPPSAKLVFNKQWSKALHAHDVMQVTTEIERRWQRVVR
jgi:hypothetical protein